MSIIYRPYEPEPRTDPPEERHIEADCDDGIYTGMRLITAPDGRTLCEECFMEEISNMGIAYLAGCLGYDVTIVP